MVSKEWDGVKAELDGGDMGRGGGLFGKKPQIWGLFYIFQFIVNEDKRASVEAPFTFYRSTILKLTGGGESTGVEEKKASTW